VAPTTGLELVPQKGPGAANAPAAWSAPTHEQPISFTRSRASRRFSSNAFLPWRPTASTSLPWWRKPAKGCHGQEGFIACPRPELARAL